MNDSKENKHTLYSKVVWVIYTVLVAAVVVFLFTVVAQDNEEKFFYSLMTAAVSYVFRPTDKVINKVVFRLFGVEPSAEPDTNK
jgi:hypothetical protein